MVLHHLQMTGQDDRKDDNPHRCTFRRITLYKLTLNWVEPHALDFTLCELQYYKINNLVWKWIWNRGSLNVLNLWLLMVHPPNQYQYCQVFHKELYLAL